MMGKILIFLFASVAFGCSTFREVISSNNAPQPIGPYNQGVLIKRTLYVSGQIGLNPEGDLDSTSIENECRQALRNVEAIVQAAGMKLKNVTKTTVYLTRIKDYGKVNTVYVEFFKDEFPAREAVEVRSLPGSAHIEISVIAQK